MPSYPLPPRLTFARLRKHSSIASFLFPIFASYKALKSSDPAQLTPWLMYWVVFSCAILVESWFSWILFWIPFYGYVRLIFFLYLILPQTQGARMIYEEKIHPFLEENEGHIDDFIASAHDRLKAAGLDYFRRAIDYLKTAVLGLPPSEPAPSTPEPAAGPQSYTQSLLARFSVPTGRWAAPSNASGDFYNLLAGAVSAATSAGGLGLSSNSAPPGHRQLIPPNLRDTGEKMSFITAQRERLNILLTALDREAQALQREDTHRAHARAPSMTFDGHSHDDDSSPAHRPLSAVSGWSGLSKSRSEADFEKIEAESGAEEEEAVRRRNVSGSSWLSWAMGSGNSSEGASSSGFDRSGGDPSNGGR
ncbi:Receptor expression-enhancing protein 4 [Paramyrothecium foliicola]|nr:Receptor expression-enhancing protein 4 [Paramyrothecium foliicola]